MSMTAADYRLDWILHEGDTIQTADATYTITGEPIGLGGSSVLYQARKNGSKKMYAIKECFPGQPEYKDAFERQGGIVRAKSPSAQAHLNRYRAALLKEEKIGEIIWNNSRRAIGIQEKLNPISVTTKGEVCSDVSDGVFCLMERIDQKALSFDSVIEQIKQYASTEESQAYNGPPKIHMTVCLIEQVLLALKQIHDARDPDDQEMQGYYYGDIHPGNIYFTETDIANGYVGIAHLLDFGSSWELDKNGKTVLLTYKDVFSTNGFRPPQIRQNSLFQLTKNADIYSVGCLLLKCVTSPNLFTTFGNSPQAGRKALNEKAGRAIGCTGKALKLLNDVLYKSIGYNPDEPYKDAAEMLAAIHALMDQIRPPKNQLNLSFSSLAPGEFRGREEEIKEIDRRINEHRKPIELYGFGGMGKSELVIEYCRRKMESTGIHVHFVRFDKTMRNTIVGPIADAFSGYSRFTEQGSPKSDQLIYSEVMKMLGEQDEEDILCIDNVDSETEEFADLCGKEYIDLCHLKMSLIVTTRFDRTEFGGIEVVALQRKHLHELMTHILKDSPLTLTERQMDDLIQVVDAHTLTVELIARTLKMNRPRITPEAMLEKLKAEDLGGTSLAKVSSHKDRDQQKRRIEDHIRMLFQITSLPPNELSYMKNAILMTVRHGLPYDWFAEAQPNFDQDVMQHLIDRGWINLNRQRDLLSIHPLIHSITQKEIGADILSSSDFLYGLWNIFEQCEFDGDRGEPIASLFATLPSILLNWIPDEWLDRLCKWYDKSISRIDIKISTEKKVLASLKAKKGSDYISALQYATDAINIVQSNKEMFDNEQLGSLYHLLASIYIQLKRYTDAVYYNKAAVEFDCSKGQNDLAWLYLYGYGCDKDYTLSINLFTKAALHPINPIMNSNRHLGKLYLGVHPAALDYSPLNPEKALFHLRRAKELGATDVDELVEQAHLMLNTTNP